MKLHKTIKVLLVGLLFAIMLLSMSGCVSQGNAIEKMEDYLNATYDGCFKVVYIYSPKGSGPVSAYSWSAIATEVNSHEFFHIACDKDGNITSDTYD